MNTEMMPVDSSRVTAIGYDSTTASVLVQFRDGALWQYRNVPEHVFAEFVESGSKGKFIKDVLDAFDKGPA